jgi:hypothetical protein
MEMKQRQGKPVTEEEWRRGRRTNKEMRKKIRSRVKESVIYDNERNER